MKLGTYYSLIFNLTELRYKLYLYALDKNIKLMGDVILLRLP